MEAPPPPLESEQEKTAPVFRRWIGGEAATPWIYGLHWIMGLADRSSHPGVRHHRYHHRAADERLQHTNRSGSWTLPVAN